MKNSNITINLPKNVKIIVWKNKINIYNKLFLTHQSKSFKLLYNDKIFLDKWSNSITFLKNKNNYSSVKIENKINEFLKSINIYFFEKIKFKGKGFRIKFFKKIKIIKFYFGRSHKTFLLLKKIKKKKISKYKFMLFNINKNKLNNIGNIICNIKKLNFYTLRGLRKSRQIIYKRKGKKGTYI